MEFMYFKNSKYLVNMSMVIAIHPFKRKEADGSFKTYLNIVFTGSMPDSVIQDEEDIENFFTTLQNSKLS